FFQSSKPMPEQQQSPQNGGSSGGALTEQQRKRVSLILNSEAFQRELDDIIQSQVRSGAHPASLMALQQIADLLLPTARGGAGAGFGVGSAGHQNLPPPINDIRGSNVGHYCGGRAERQLRCKLAAVHRLLHARGWSDGLYCQAFARAGADAYLAKPVGLACREATASCFSRLNSDGTVADPGGTVFGCAPPDPEAWSVALALFNARPDLNAIVLLQTPEVLAVVNCRAGLLPLCAEAQQLGRTAVVSDTDPKAVAAAAAEGADAVLLPGRCACVCGATVEAAWRRAELLAAAANSQLETLRSIGLENLSLPAEDSSADKPVEEAAIEGNGGEDGEAKQREWSFGQLEFEAAMRQLDSAGYRTGYEYLEPSVRAVRPGEVFMVLERRDDDGNDDIANRSGRTGAGGVTSDSESERRNAGGGGALSDTLKSDVTSGGEESATAAAEASADGEDHKKSSKKKKSGSGFRIPSFSRSKKDAAGSK
uniref:Aldolase_II domain-containing protein n=2 Tax=Macrostomum lignano TaxID=282301 RepID=A0A1I8HS42_9PLAT